MKIKGCAAPYLMPREIVVASLCSSLGQSARITLSGSTLLSGPLVVMLVPSLLVSLVAAESSPGPLTACTFAYPRIQVKT